MAKQHTPEQLAHQLRTQLLADIDATVARLDVLQREITEALARRNALQDQLRKLWP